MPTAKPAAPSKSDRMPKDQLLAFKVDAKLAELLSRVKNRSELIRDAVYAYLGHLCPLCEGKGTIPANRSHEIELLLAQLEFATCSGCHTALPVMPRLRQLVGAMPSEDRQRLTEFEKTGELLCSDCFEKAEQCDSCGQHVPQGRWSDHVHKLHHRNTGRTAKAIRRSAQKPASPRMKVGVVKSGSDTMA